MASSIPVGCFALVEPFSSLRRQFAAIRELGFEYADLTDSHDGALLGNEFGFTAAASLDTHPEPILEMVRSAGLTLTAVCAHANLLDAAAPEVYGTHQIVKAIKLAHFLGVGQVITTEGDPKTPFGRSLSADERVFTVVEKLQTPLRWATTLGVELLLEPHGVVTDDADATARVLDRLGQEQTLGLNLDTGNLWLGGGDPIGYIRRFGSRIRHVHWKDLDASWAAKRGTIHGCGMGLVALGDGVIGLQEIARTLRQSGFSGPTTLEVVGKDAVLASAARLKQWLA